PPNSPLFPYTTLFRSAGILGSLSVRPREPRDERWRVTYFTAVTGARASEWMRRLRRSMRRSRHTSPSASWIHRERASCPTVVTRSEEHTSELQSLAYL